MVDPEPGGRIARVCGTAASGVGHDGVPGSVGDVGGEKAARSLDQALDLLRAQSSRSYGMDLFRRQSKSRI